MRRVERYPQDDDKKEMERKRTFLLAEFELLSASYRRAVKFSGTAAGALIEYDEETDDFDNLDNEIMVEDDIPDEASNSADVGDANVAPERRPLLMPSTCLPKEHSLSNVELRLRKNQAIRYIMALREVIAEKSFQYSHVIRVAPRKQVLTRARKAILRLNDKISFYSRMYSRCRAALLRLAADSEISQFQILTKQDVKASSAVMDPNVPGSTSVSLSWIWQVSTAEDSPAGLRECMLKFY